MRMGPRETPPRFARLRAEPSGRPELFAVMKDAALEIGYIVGAREADIARDIWNRAPEEWELQRVKDCWAFSVENIGSYFVSDR